MCMCMFDNTNRFADKSGRKIQAAAAHRVVIVIFTDANYINDNTYNNDNNTDINDNKYNKD